MALRYATIGLTSRSDLEGAAQTLLRVAKIAEKAGATVLVDAERRPTTLKKHRPFSSTKNLDLLLVVGGDGTIIRAVREMDDLSVPILSINKGTIGFLAELSLHETEKLLPKFLRGDEGVLEERGLLSITAKRGTKTILSGRVLNEAVISQGAIARLIDLETYVNGDLLSTFHADGVIIATPTGSTAYSLAAGGPIVHPELQATILTPINPHSFSQKPLILSADDQIDVTILTKESRYDDLQVSLTLDGQTYITLKGGDTVRACACGETVKFLRRNEETYFSTLRTKLKWGERLEE